MHLGRPQNRKRALCRGCDRCHADKRNESLPRNAIKLPDVHRHTHSVVPLSSGLECPRGPCRTSQVPTPVCVPHAPLESPTVPLALKLRGLVKPTLGQLTHRNLLPFLVKKIIVHSSSKNVFLMLDSGNSHARTASNRLQVVDLGSNWDVRNKTKSCQEASHLAKRWIALFPLQWNLGRG